MCLSQGPSHRHIYHRRASHRPTSPIGHLIGYLICVPLTGVHLLYACLSRRPSHRRASPIDHCLIGVFLIGVFLIGVSLIGVSLIGRSLIGRSLIGVSLISGYL